MTPLDVLRAVEACGGQVKVQDGALRVAAPEPLPAELVAALRAHKAGVVRLLETEGTAHPAPGAPWSLDRCQLHNRHLVYGEMQAACCWWCHPERSPPDHPIRKLSPEERERLIPPPLPTGPIRPADPGAHEE